MMMRVVLAFGTQRREWKRFRKQGESWADETVGLTVRQTAFKLVVQLITSCGTAAVIGVGAYQAVNGQITAGELLVVLSYITQIYKPLEELTNTITSFQQQFINLLMSFDLMDMKPEVTEKSGAQTAAEGPRGDRARRCRFRLRAAARGVEGRLAPRPARTCGGDRRPDGRGQIDARQPPAAVLRRERGQRADRRPRRPRSEARRPPQPVQHRAPGAAAVLRDDRHQHQLRKAERLRGGGDRCGKGGERPRLHLGVPRRLQHAAGGGRREDVGWRAPADRRRPGLSPGCPDPDPRRAHVLDRLPHRIGDPGCTRPVDAGPDDDPDRPPALDDPKRRRDPGDGRRSDRPAGDPRGTGQPARPV